MKESIKEATSRPAAIVSLAEMGLPLEEMIRRGARQIIQQAIETEVQVLTSSYAHVRTPGGQQAVVRNGYLPERDILTAAGAVAVKVPKVRDRSGMLS